MDSGERGGLRSGSKKEHLAAMSKDIHIVKSLYLCTYLPNSMSLLTLDGAGQNRIGTGNLETGPLHDNVGFDNACVNMVDACLRCRYCTDTAS